METSPASSCSRAGREKKDEAKLALSVELADCAKPSRHTLAIKVIEIFGNDTMTLVPVTLG